MTRGQQIANYVTNGSFEILKPNSTHPPSMAFPPVLIGWSAIDTNQCGFVVANSTFSNVPLTSPCDYQWPRTGNGFVMNSVFIQNYNTWSYWRNRLKTQLVSGVQYCVKYHVNVRNCSTYGIDTYGVYFGDNTLDTITKPYFPKTYLTPQISNPPGNFITDTLGWTPLTGTFTASGNEKYLVIGNFKSSANTTYSPIVQPPQNNPWCDINIDDVSVIPVELPAYAGPDQYCIPGDSVYIGRLQDFATDSVCVWYKLPNVTTAIDTASGLWVKPVVTTTYVVRQQLECSALKWDTVVVYQTAVGVQSVQSLSNSLKLFPNPSNDRLNISFSSIVDVTDGQITITNNLGQLIRQETVEFKINTATIDTKNLDEGIYQIHIRTKVGTATKQFTKVN
ncbi:MAG: T9SS type A sorting domain-containing protein [Bacteroidota bacterium]|nr:T9SS type A sorting domain-containing protein [Bacteroidota bacterium]